MIIVDDLWLHSKEFLGKDIANSFKIVIQLGSILAVVVVFFGRFLDLLGLKRKKDTHGNFPSSRLKLNHVVIGLIPAGILGLLFDDLIDEYLFDVKYVIYSLIAGSILMIFADRISRKRKQVVETVDKITYKQAFYIGLF